MLKGVRSMYPYDSYILYCENAAAKMYPKIYKEIYPFVVNTCEMEDYYGNPEMQPFPREEKVQKMVEEIYENYRKRDKKTRGEEGELEDLYRIKRSDLQDLIMILLLRELLDRRRRFPRRRRPGFFAPGFPGFF